MYRIVHPLEDADDHARCHAAIEALEGMEPGHPCLAFVDDGTCYPWATRVPSGGFGDPVRPGFELRLVSPAATPACLLRFTDIGAAHLMQELVETYDERCVVGSAGGGYLSTTSMARVAGWLLQRYGCTPPFKTTSMLEDMS